jgi:hypothetical protein
MLGDERRRLISVRSLERLVAKRFAEAGLPTELPPLSELELPRIRKRRKANASPDDAE